MAVTAQTRRRALEVAEGLRELYPDARCALNFRSPLELLIATILSAQCTDERVNIVTRELFKKYRSAADYAAAPIAELEEMIRSAGFYRMKAKNIQACCRALVEQHGGDVPKELAALVLLGGVGRKTANVVLGTAFGIPSGVVVDTHVTRLTYRLGLTKQTDAVKIEEDLMAALPPEEWIDFSHRLIWHGRKICTARKPLCEECRLNPICPKNGVAKSTTMKTPAAKKAAEKGPKPKIAKRSDAARAGKPKGRSAEIAAASAGSKIAGSKNGRSTNARATNARATNAGGVGKKFAKNAARSRG
jgi:endonuclease-3